MHHLFLLDAVSQHQYQSQQRLICAPRQTQMELHILCTHSVSISIRLLEARRNGSDVAVPPENVGAVPSTGMVTASCSPSPTGTLCKFQHLMRVTPDIRKYWEQLSSSISLIVNTNGTNSSSTCHTWARCFTASQNNAASDFLPLFKQIHN